MSDAGPTVESVTRDFLRKHNLRQVELIALVATALGRHGAKGRPSVSAISNYVHGARSSNYWWFNSIYLESQDDRRL
jgi:hypothetical protein